MKILHQTIVFLIILIGFRTVASAQIMATTKEGQRVVLFTDGTWKFETEVDSAQIREGILQIVPATPVVAEVVPEPPKPKPKPPRVYSLECPDLVDVERDITSDANIKISRTQKILKEDSTVSFSVSLTKTKKSTLWWMTKIPGNTCIKSDNKMFLVMSDGSRFTIETDSKDNCNGEFRLNFGGIDGKDDILTSMKANLILSLRIYTATGYVEGTFDEENGKKWRAAVNCMYNK